MEGGGSCPVELDSRRKKRGVTHQDSRQNNWVGVGPGRGGSSGAVSVATSWSARRWMELGLGPGRLKAVDAAADAVAGAVAVAAAEGGRGVVSSSRCWTGTTKADPAAEGCDSGSGRGRGPANECSRSSCVSRVPTCS